MGRAQRMAKGGLVYHVLNRANARRPIFQRAGDYAAFEAVLVETCDRIPMRILAWCLMPNHWHLVLWPVHDGDLSQFMRLLTLTHTQRWHAAHESVGSGHLYQGRFKSFPIQGDAHLLTVCRYVERNPLRAGLVQRAQDWRWSSCWYFNTGSPAGHVSHRRWPVERPRDWVGFVNGEPAEGELDNLRCCVARGRPFGAADWTRRMTTTLGLESTLRRPGRPKKEGGE